MEEKIYKELLGTTVSIAFIDGKGIIGSIEDVQNGIIKVIVDTKTFYIPISSIKYIKA